MMARQHKGTFVAEVTSSVFSTVNSNHKAYTRPKLQPMSSLASRLQISQKSSTAGAKAAAGYLVNGASIRSVRKTLIFSVELVPFKKIHKPQPEGLGD